MIDDLIAVPTVGHSWLLTFNCWHRQASYWDLPYGTVQLCVRCYHALKAPPASAALRRVIRCDGRRQHG
jgi:hypothetical protein